MKRAMLERHLRGHGCAFVRHGGRHDWWRNTDGSRHTAMPRHREINELLAAKICRDLGVPKP